MTDPKSLYNSPSNKGLATPILNMWGPSLAVEEQQRKEGEIKKGQKATAQQNAVAENHAFGEDLFKDKFNSYTTQINDYKNSRLKDLKERYNKANFDYSAQGKSIPLEVRQDLGRNLQEFKDNYEQIETAYKYTDGILKQAAKDTSGIYNLDALREVLLDVPTKADGTVDFTQYNERFTEANLKKNATSILNAPKVAETFMTTVAESKLSKIQSLGTGQHDDIKEVAKGLKQFQQPDGTMGYENPKTGLPEMDDSPGALALARKDEKMNMLIEAKVANGEAETPMEAYQQLIHNQAYLKKDIDRRGSIKTDKSGNGGGGSLKPDQEATFDLLRDIVGYRRSIKPASINALKNFKDIKDLRYRSGRNLYKSGSPEFNAAIQDMSQPTGRRLAPGEDTPFNAIEIDVFAGEDLYKQPKIETLTFGIGSDQDKDKAMREVNNLLSKVEKYKAGTISQAELNRSIKAIQKEDPLELYPVEAETENINPEGEPLY